jgi:hypothetical protein
MKNPQRAGFDSWYKQNKLNEEFGGDFEDIGIERDSIDGNLDDTGSGNNIYVLALYVDMSGGPGAMIESIIKISQNKEELESYAQSLPEIEYDEDEQEYDGMQVSDRPYYHISEHRLNVD